MSYSDELTPALLDKGKRASDIINTYIVGLDFETIKHSYIAIRLSDGGSDGVLYETRLAAVENQYNERQCAYVCLKDLPSGADPRDMAIYIKMNRDAYYSGLRLVDDEHPNGAGGEQALMTSKLRDFYRGRLGI